MPLSWSFFLCTLNPPVPLNKQPFTSWTLERISLLLDWLVTLVKVLVSLEVSLSAEGPATIPAFHLTLGDPCPCIFSSNILHYLFPLAPLHRQSTSSPNLILHSSHCTTPSCMLKHWPSSFCRTLVAYIPCNSLP